MNKNNNTKSIEDDDNLEKPSYTYWKRPSDNSTDANQFQPQKSTGEIDERTSSPHPQPCVGSAWNKAGTWEEKHITKTQVEDFFNKALSEKKIVLKNSFQINKIYAYEGDTYYVFIRGKIKFVYDCEMKMEIEGVNEFIGVKSDIGIKEINNHGLDDELQFDYGDLAKGDYEDKDQAISMIGSAESEIQRMIKETFDELKSSCLGK